MIASSILIFSISLSFFWLVYVLLGKKYALDYPDSRKQHNEVIPQIGGLVFGPLILFFFSWLEFVPSWYIIGGVISIFLGAIDDKFFVPWQLKLLVQLCIASYLSYIFWGCFNEIYFYNYSFTLSPIMLLIIFLIWFVGIYNAVNLLDGLDGLAGGYIFLVLIGIAISGSNQFFELNGIFTLVIISFLIFNQRPAKIFMGDAGSLFLGFHIATLPLLFSDISNSLHSLNMTPFVLLTFFLIADTSRVFFTRLATKTSPMTPDTIHFHHLVLQQSGSYLAATGSIFITTLMSVIVAIFSFNSTFSSNVMLGHLSLLLLFILMPPVKVYMPFLAQIIKPLYSWQSKNKSDKPLFIRTLFIIIMFIFLIISFSIYYDIYQIINFSNIFPLFLILFFCFLNKRDKMIMYVIQLTSIILFVEIVSISDFGIITKLFTTLICMSYFIFTLERRHGCRIRDYSTLDLLLIIIVIGGLFISTLGFDISSWFFMTMLAIWFSIRFIFYRMIYYH